MKVIKWYFHPIFIFILSILALGTSLTMYIYWYVTVSDGLQTVIEKFNLNPSQFLEAETWVVILFLSLMVGLILLGLNIIFVYNLKTIQLYRLQNNFINNFTHELKTPVTSLKLFLETFLKYKLTPEEQEKYLNYMLSDVARLSENINSILNLGKIESKKAEIHPVETELNTFLEEFIRKNSYLFSNGEIKKITKNRVETLALIDPALFEIVLLNLITNGFKYNRSEKPVMEIELFTTQKTVFIEFTDNGIGIPQKEQKKIFHKFYQIGKAENRSAKGSGLGLYMVSNILKKHKGSIFAKNRTDGKGSVFTLTLPSLKQEI